MTALAKGWRSLDGWISIATLAAFALFFLPFARNRDPGDFSERLGALAGFLLLTNDGEMLSSLPRGYVAVPLAWALFTAAVLLARRPVGRRMQLLRGAGLVGMVSVAFWPGIWPADATLFRRIDVQVSLALAIFSAGLLLRLLARPAPAQPDPA
ncbi:hypothetical protein [Longimicrobium sp.]|uniref:hypothetical protein n=1 Tax=Longimicrobium sp. TaxID=2029185 RepID=UPI002ED887B7